MTNKTQKQVQHSMSNTIDIPVHSNATLLKASIAATVIAAVVLVIAILPAEYNIDPTGIGKSLGLTKIATAADASLSSNQPLPSVMASADSIIINTAPTVAEIKEIRAKVVGLRQDSVDILIPAGKGLEYKLLLNEGEHLEYEWRTDGSELYFDFHGEPQGDKTGFYESFAITTSDQMQGTLTTPFAGAHGWYWKNKTSEPITVTLATKGAYLIKG
ncbi:hypothetical protein [Shewanella kaireitica]|uniref:hypothetical protein n=1 Tax=Shewanella kaireitica TaxID=212021 RepID=UPI00200F17D3|nr:hypothetical protein [Shewanella kaireitica]MCL1095843.1 hypothetical protein [Shewanella kaireitica]